MSIDSVKQYFRDRNLDLNVIEFKESSATVELAAQLLGVEPARIAKTMAFQLKERAVLIIAKGDARVDNRKYKDYFGEKAKMLKADQVSAVTGHPIGGVCPFGLSSPLAIYLDENLKEFDYVYPAGGSPHSAVRITVNQLAEVTQGQWVDVCS